MEARTGASGAQLFRVERFPALARHGGLRHGFVGRIPGLDLRVERAAAMPVLERNHREILRADGCGSTLLASAEQVHGAAVVCLARNQPLPGFPAAGADALLTDRRDLLLGIYVADCAAVYLADRRGRACGLVHSGKKGTAAGILVRAIELFETRFGIPAQDLTVQISPCIRPPRYEIDFAADIVSQAHGCGVGETVDCGICTGDDPVHYYSYRMEKGRTGRMLAYLGLAAA